MKSRTTYRRFPLFPLIAATATLGVAGCGSDADDDRAATATQPAITQPSVTTDTPEPDTSTATTATSDDEQLSPESRALLAASQDLAADIATTAKDLQDDRLDSDEATAQFRLAAERAGELGDRAQQLPDADRARARLTTLNEQIARTADDLSKLAADGRSATSSEIDDRIAELRGAARSTLSAVSKQLDSSARKRFGDALDRIGPAAPG